MPNYNSALQLIRFSSRILLTSHIRPDGDAVGSLAALKLILDSAAAQTGKNTAAQLLLLDSVGPVYQFLLPPKTWFLGSEITKEQIDAGFLDDFDLIVVLDTGSKMQLAPLADYLSRRQQSILVIDHHLSNDNLGTVQVIDSHAAATGEIVYHLARQADWDIPPDAAEALLAAITTDTGWFRFENTSARTLQIASDLVQCGAHPALLYEKLFLNDSPARLHLLAAALATLQLQCEGRLALMHITNKMLADCNARRSDIENLVNTPMQIGSVLLSALLVELDDGSTRVSFRSKRDIDVNALARTFGGGGHARAAGATLTQPLSFALTQITSALQKTLSPIP